MSTLPTGPLVNVECGPANPDGWVTLFREADFEARR
jgi:hypothetical protein